VSQTKEISPLVKRDWCYCQKPAVYEVSCDLCGGDNTTWSEYQGRIWCFDCVRDTRGTGGVFGGPIPLAACELMGLSFDRIRLSDGKRLRMMISHNGISWEEA
jgi:hypothetical protein